MAFSEKLKRVVNNPAHYFRHYSNCIKNRINSCVEPVRRRRRLSRIEKIKDIHAGEKCVIIGMGPSLRASDLDRFKGIPTIACNKIYLAFDETDWRPDYYMVSDVLVAENNKEEIKKIEAPKYFPEGLERYCSGVKGINWIPRSRSSKYKPGISAGFATDLSTGIESGGGTVIYDMLQLAYHLGFVEVALVGIDFSFNLSKSSGDVCEQGEVLISEGELNHFSKNYRKPGETWTVPNLLEQKIAFTKAADTFAANNRILVNASRKTMLEEVNVVNFDEYFSS